MKFTDAIGSGDIVFLLCLALIMNTPVFLFFNVVSLFAIAVFWLWFSQKKTPPISTVPLAGLQALLLVLFLIIQLPFPAASINSENVFWWQII
jgi:hypothetical protein